MKQDTDEIGLAIRDAVQAGHDVEVRVVVRRDRLPGKVRLIYDDWMKPAAAETSVPVSTK